MSVQDYTLLITSEHSDKPNFVAMVGQDTQIQGRIQDILASMIDAFDIDKASGIQLDIIGQWAGASRFINEPLTGIYFEWNNPDLGWATGIWQGEFSPTSGLTSLPDDVYVNLIKAKIAANSWDGTIPTAYEIWESVFTDTVIMIQDNQNMTIIIAVQGQPLDILTQSLLTGGYIPLKPEGVEVAYYAVPVDNNPLFAWGTEGTGVSGWGTGSWAKILAPT